MPVVMPQLGESIVEATLAKWCVQPGDRVERGQVIAEVETDKAVNDIPAPEPGVVEALLVAEGETVPVGQQIMTFEGEVVLATPMAELPVSDGGLPTVESSDDGEFVHRLPNRHLADRPLGRKASPAVRRIARERGIDLDHVRGTGRGGRVTRQDVLDFVVTPAPISGSATPRGRSAPPAPRQSTPTTDELPMPQARTGYRVYRVPQYKLQPGDQAVPFSRRRSYISEHMVHSLGTAAHVAAVTEIDMSQVARVRAADRVAAERRGIRLTYTAYVVAAVARSLDTFPELNGTVKGDSLILRANRNIGVAVDTPEGLIVPVIHNADELGLYGIARAISRLSEKARAGQLGASELSGGSFTISNPGRDGNLFGVSIIRQPEVGILRMGAITKRPVVRQMNGEDVIVIRPIMYAALSYDHRVIDGGTGNGFLSELRRRLENVEPANESLRP